MHALGTDPEWSEERLMRKAKIAGFMIRRDRPLISEKKFYPRPHDA
jgi:hypothetical protein